MPADQRPLFPTYLLPAISFSTSRRQSSTDYSIPSLSSSPTSSAATSPSISPSVPHFIPSSPAAPSLQGLLSTALKAAPKPAILSNRLSTTRPAVLKCAKCATDIAFASQIVSKGFTGRYGRAYLVSAPPRGPYSPAAEKKNPSSKELVNIKTHRLTNRELLTGAHVVADVSCVVCGTGLGWKYVHAQEPAQRYKIGKFILETQRVVVAVSWEEEDGIVKTERDREFDVVFPNAALEDDVVVFDSEDEDECEELFLGVWDPVVIAKRRLRSGTANRKGKSIS